MVLIEQQNEKIDFLVEAQMASTKQLNEKIEFLADAEKLIIYIHYMWYM
jgi:hypothetical protein